MTGPTLLQLPIRELIPDPRQPRRTFDAAELERLAASIKAQGIIQPLVVRPIAATENIVSRGRASVLVAKYVIVAGERRWRAAQLTAAGPLATVPAIVRDGMDTATVRAVQIAENGPRVDLSPLELAESYERWLQAAQKDGRLGAQKELAAAIGETEAHVSQVLALRELPKPAQALIDSGAYSFAHGRELGRLRDHPAAQRAIVQLLEERVKWGYTFTTRELAERVSTKLAQAKAAAARKAAAKKGKGKPAGKSWMQEYREREERERREAARRREVRAAGLRVAGPKISQAFAAAPTHKLVKRIPPALLRAIADGLRLPNWGEDGEIVGALKVGPAPARRVAAWLWLRGRTAALNAQISKAGAAVVSARKAAAPPVRKGGGK